MSTPGTSGPLAAPPGATPSTGATVGAGVGGSPGPVPAPAAGGVAAPAPPGTWRAFLREPRGVLALGVLTALVVVGASGPLLVAAPASYGDDVLAGPSAAAPFGTDALGRSVLAQVVWGTRSSLLVAAAASAIAIVVGTAVAVAAAWYRRLDAPVSAVVDLVLALPVLPLMILVAALVGPSSQTTVLVIAAFSWPEVTRLVRSSALTVVALPYVDAARLVTGSSLWILRKHVIPAVVPVIVVSVVVTASRAVLSAAGLAFLGLGDPSTWSWGRTLYEAQQSGAMSSAWWLTLFPSLAILALVLAATLASVAYDDARRSRGGGRA